MFDSLGADLSDLPECQRVLNHPIFARVREQGLSREGADIFIGQFWHPSHYFPTFLAGLIAEAPELGIKTSLSRILWQELGQGDPKRAHESIYVDTVTDLGLSDPSTPEDAPFHATVELVDQFKFAATDYLSGLGGIYATEAIDLTVVKGLGYAIAAATDATEIPWVDIHAEQEPDHIESASAAVDFDLSPTESARVREAACVMWTKWYEFYNELELELFGAGVAAEGAQAAVTQPRG